MVPHPQPDDQVHRARHDRRLLDLRDRGQRLQDLVRVLQHVLGEDARVRDQREAEGRPVDLRAVAADHPGPLQAGDPLGDRRRRHADFARDPPLRGARVGDQLLEDREVHGLAELLRELPEGRVKLVAQRATTGGAQPSEARAHPDLARRRRGHQILDLEGLHDPVDRGLRQFDRLRELGEAEPGAMVGQRAQDACRARDELDAVAALGGLCRGNGHEGHHFTVLSNGTGVPWVGT